MTDELRTALAIANITRNTREPGDDYPSQFGSLKPRALADCILTLADEVTRLRAGVERVKGLITYDAELGGYKEGGPFVYRDDVLEALGVRDDD